MPERWHRPVFGEQCLENRQTYSTNDGKEADPSKKIKDVN